MSIKRRTEKAWRFHDRESSGTQSLYAIVVSLQGIIIGILSVVFSTGHTIPLLPPYILAAITLLVLFFLALWGRNLDSDRAAYFYTVSSPESEWPKGFDAHEEDKRWKAKHKYYNAFRWKAEIVAFGCALVNIGLLWFFITRDC